MDATPPDEHDLRLLETPYRAADEFLNAYYVVDQKRTLEYRTKDGKSEFYVVDARSGYWRAVGHEYLRGEIYNWLDGKNLDVHPNHVDAIIDGLRAMTRTEVL